MEKELDAARELAREAGRILMEYYAEDPKDTNVQWKGRDDPVTAADQAANELLARELSRRFPGDAVLTEELPDDLTRLKKERVWAVDPMDGTKQFIERIGEFAVMIGLAINGEAKMGVVYNPSTDQMYYAATGTGAFVEGKWSTKRLRVTTITDPSQMVMATSRSHPSRKVFLIGERLGVSKQIQSGSVGLKFGLIAEGLASLYINSSSRTCLWDTCAPEAILREAGGIVTDCDGQSLKYNGPEVRNIRGIMASNGQIHNRALEVAAEVFAE